MDKLWAPWRISYLKNKQKPGCLFCRIARQKSDKKNYILLRSQFCFAVLNRFPYNNGHLLLSPYRHTAKLEKLKNQEVIDIHHTMLKLKKILSDILAPAGFNAGINLGKDAGSGISGHLHFHLVPRWRGDTNFMPIFSGTKVISQSLAELYAKIKMKLK